MDFQQFSDALKNADFPLEFPGHWLGEKWLQGNQEKPLKESINPSNGQNIITPTTDKGVFLQALDKAVIGQEKLHSLSTDERVELIRQLRQGLADFQVETIACLRIQGGKPAWDARIEFDSAITYLDSICEEAESIQQAVLKPAKLGIIKGEFRLTPIGTTFAFLPFSTPVLSFAKYFSSAILAGCPLILCPSSHASLCGLLYGYLAEKLEIPVGALSVVFGNFDTFRKILPDKRIKAIIYTGSRDHCDLIRRESKSSRQLIVQSGGKNSALVHSSADIEHAIKCVSLGAFQSAGQLCSSTSRVFVHKSLAPDFCENFYAKVAALRIGPTDDLSSENEDTFLGPLYSKKAVEKFFRYQTMAHREAAEDLMWGKPAGDKNSCLVTPGIHMMKEFDPASSYQNSVLFCPDVAIYTYEVLDDVIEQINHTDAPFCVSFIGDEEVIDKRRHMFQAPNLLINLPTVEVENRPALTGKNQSGHHRYNGAGLTLLLSYPQLLRSNQQHSKLLSAWTW